MNQQIRYELGEDDFERFRRLLSQVSGVYFDRGKWDLLRLGLADRAQARGAADLEEYYQMVTADDDREQEVRDLLARLAVKETQFFRSLPQFDALRRYLIPELFRRKQEHRKIRLWSAGCSAGQEAYSLAMSVMDVMPEADGWNIEVLGTDLDAENLKTAERAWYPESMMAGVDPKHRNKYFIPQEGGFKVREQVRDMVRFMQHNMVTDPLPIEKFGTCDIIFCRNVMVYFTHQTAKYVVELFYDILNPGGYLFLGHSEGLWQMSSKYSLVEIGDTFIYRKSLPRTMGGKRFLPDRRMRQTPLPGGVTSDRRISEGRRITQRAENPFGPGAPRVVAAGGDVAAAGGGTEDSFSEE